ncbi:MAG: hypothetical protein PHT12_04960 [Patescibacteria group bacterium]|nr:hypothetical protein [Patescibacteria group bacterium]
MANPVEAETYRDLDRQLLELKRQLNQGGGYPYSPTVLGRALQDIIDGRLRPTTLLVNYDDSRWRRPNPNLLRGALAIDFPVRYTGLALVEFQLIEVPGWDLNGPKIGLAHEALVARNLSRGDLAEVETYLDNDPDEGRILVAGLCLPNDGLGEADRRALIFGNRHSRAYRVISDAAYWQKRYLFLGVRHRQPIVLP